MKASRSKLSAPIGKRGASKKSTKFKMPKAKTVTVKKFKLGKTPSKKPSKGYKGVSVKGD